MNRALPATGLLILLTGATFALAVLAQDRTLLVTLVAVALAGSGVLVLLWWKMDVETKDVLILALVFRIAMFWLPPSLSDDAYRYVWDGIVQAHGVNPYEYRPNDMRLERLHQEEVYSRLNSRSFYSVYPPVSQYIFRLGSVFYGLTWQGSHYAIKAVLVLAELLALLMLSRLVTARSMMLYALNPLVLLETAGQGHTESLLILLLIIAIVALRSNKRITASIALSAAVWVKLYPLFLLPFLWRRVGWRASGVGALALALLAMPFAAPMVVSNVRESLDLYVRYFEFNAGLYYGIKQGLLWLTGADFSKQIGPALRTCFLLALPLVYAVDFRRRWPLEKACLVVLALYILFSTTVHPWYLLTILLLATFLERPLWFWLWIGAFSIGTYLLYSGGPYWVFVIIAWGGGAILAAIRAVPVGMQRLLRGRAWRKVWTIKPYLPRIKRPLQVLDLGCGEGYVGERISQGMQAEVTLADIVDMNKTDLPHVVYDGRRLPWAAGSFDAVVLYFVLHHAQNPRAVIREALRVAPQRVIIVESVCRSSLGCKLLTALDRVANRMRHWRHMSAQEANLNIRSEQAWRTVLRDLGAPILAEASHGVLIDRHKVYVVHAFGVQAA